MADKRENNRDVNFSATAKLDSTKESFIAKKKIACCQWWMCVIIGLVAVSPFGLLVWLMIKSKTNPSELLLLAVSFNAVLFPFYVIMLFLRKCCKEHRAEAMWYEMLAQLSGLIVWDNERKKKQPLFFRKIVTDFFELTKSHPLWKTEED